MKKFKMKQYCLLLALALLLTLALVPQKAGAAMYADAVTLKENAVTGYCGWATLDTSTHTITMTSDVEFRAKHSLIVDSGEWTLDLNGKTIIGSPPIDVRKGASLTIIGSGSLRGEDYFSGGYYFYPDGIEIGENATVRIQGGDIQISSSMSTLGDTNFSAAIDIYRGALYIESGNITLNGYENGVDSSYGQVYITGGNVTVNAPVGIDPYDGAMTLSGGVLTVNGKQTLGSYTTANITGGVLNMGDTMGNATVNHTGGAIYDKTAGTVTAIDLAEDYTLPANATLTVAEGETLTLNDGAVLTIPETATLVNNGNIYFNDGAQIVNNGTLTDNGNLYVDGAAHWHGLSPSYKDLGDGTHRTTNACRDCPVGYEEATVEAHMYQYRVTDQTTVEYCYWCDFENEISVSGAATMTYNGSAYPATIEGAPVNPLASVRAKYFDQNFASLGVTAPVDAGSYYVGMETLQDGESISQIIVFPFTIEPKELAVVGAEVENKAYDGTQEMSVNELLVDGVAEDDNVYATVGMCVVDSPDAGEYSTVMLSKLALEGEDSANYTISPMAWDVPVYDYWGDEVKAIIYQQDLHIEALDQAVERNAALDLTKWELENPEALAPNHTVAQVTLAGDTSKATDFGTVTAGNVIIHDANGNDVTANYRISCTEGRLIVTCPEHYLFTNGFCLECGGWQMPVIDPGEDPEWTYDDTYYVSNAGQLLWIAGYVNNVNNEVTVQLTADISVPAGVVWTPIMNFYGTFDGNFKTVSGLYAEGEEQVAMFGGGGYSYGTIKNLHLTNSYFKGTNYVGGIAGYHAGTIQNCYADDSVVLVSEGSTGAVVGHLAGTAENCYAIGNAVIGYYNSGYSYVNNCYYLAETETEDGGKTAAQFKNGEVAYLLQAGVLEDGYYDENDNRVSFIPEIWG